MEVKLKLADKNTANIIKNMYPLYLHDLSEHYGNFPNDFGIYEDEPMTTLMEQYEVQNIWFEKPEVLFPYIITVDDKPAGFALVTTAQYAPKGVDYYLAEFFLLRPYRGKNIAQLAAQELFTKCTGKWELYTNYLPKNVVGQKFWRKVISTFTNNNYEETIGDTMNGVLMIFKFDSGK